MATPLGPGQTQPVATNGQIVPVPNPDTASSPQQTGAEGEAMTEASPNSDRNDPTLPPVPGVGGAPGADPFISPER